MKLSLIKIGMLNIICRRCDFKCVNFAHNTGIDVLSIQVNMFSCIVTIKPQNWSHSHKPQIANISVTQVELWTNERHFISCCLGKAMTNLQTLLWGKNKCIEVNIIDSVPLIFDVAYVKTTLYHQRIFYWHSYNAVWFLSCFLKRNFSRYP